LSVPAATVSVIGTTITVTTDTSGSGLANQFGAPAAIGAQVFPGFRPSNEVDASRNSVAGYVDVEGDVIKWLRLGLAGRAEHYDDFGGTLDSKLTVRVQPNPRFVTGARSAPASVPRRSASRSSPRRPPTS
jgi:hypothetical protein